MTMADIPRTRHRLNQLLDKDIFFIIGWTQAGTHWLQAAIDAHQQVCCRGEGHFANLLSPLLTQAFGHYNQQLRKTNARLRTAGIQGHFHGFDNDDRDLVLATAMGLVFSRWVGDAEVKCIGEKTPEQTPHLNLLAGAAPNARFVHVIRDGRDEAAFAWDVNLRIDQQGFSEKFPRFSGFADSFAKLWANNVGRGRAFGRANPDRYMEVRCENLMSEPEPDLRRLCRFLDVGGGDAQVARCAEAGRAANISAAVPGLWRHRFDDEALTLFRRQAGEMLKLFEYED